MPDVRSHCNALLVSVFSGLHIQLFETILARRKEEEISAIFIGYHPADLDSLFFAFLVIW